MEAWRKVQTEANMVSSSTHKKGPRVAVAVRSTARRRRLVDGQEASQRTDHSFFLTCKHASTRHVHSAHSPPPQADKQVLPLSYMRVQHALHCPLGLLRGHAELAWEAFRSPFLRQGTQWSARILRYLESPRAP